MLDENKQSTISTYSKMFFATRKLFQVESKYLNADNEMIRMFGAKIVQGEKASGRQKHNQRGGNKLQFKQNAIVVKKPTWPEFKRYGLSMKILKNSATDQVSENSNEDITEFTYEHDKQYQGIQFMFMDAIESMDHNNIITVLHSCPYHIDSLIQMSDISKMSDDTQMAADLIERALYALQNSFHPSFNINFKALASTSAPVNTSIKLDYNRVENRCLFIALFKHLLYVGGKACYRTSLELCKLLLSLDIEGDPLGAILIIDFYAIRSLEYKYLVDFYELFNPFKHLNLMPNMIFSVSLAYFTLFNQTNDEEYLKKGDQLLQEGLSRFPSMLMELLDKCGVMPDRQVESQNKLFTRESNLKIPAGLKYLTDLYVTKMHFEWKIPENIQWLEKNVKFLINKENSISSLVNENKKKCRSLFSKVPSNLYRHLILSDIKEVAAHLPPEFESTATYSFDPIPPKNSIISYTRPTRKSNTSAAGATASTPAETLLTFFQSLLPSFNVQDMNNAEAGAAAAGPRRRNRNQAGQEEAVHNQGGDRFNMQQMAGRLRDFLETMDHQFPEADAADQNENDLPELEDFD